MNSFVGHGVDTVVRTQDLFTTGHNLFAQVRTLSIFAVGAVICVFFVVKLVQTRGALGPLVGLIATGAIALWAVSHMDRIQGDVGDTFQGSSVHQLIISPPSTIDLESS